MHVGASSIHVQKPYVYDYNIPNTKKPIKATVATIFQKISSRENLINKHAHMYVLLYLEACSVQVLKTLETQHVHHNIDCLILKLEI